MKIRRKHLKYVWGTLFVVAILLLIIFNMPFSKFPSTACFGNDVCVDLEIAFTDQEKAIGLMNREELSEERGMLFFYDGNSVKKFWMKNTLIPLDIIWLDENDEIIYIEHALPCEKDPCPTFGPESSSRHVLEVVGNFTIMNNVEIGEKIKIK